MMVNVQELYEDELSAYWHKQLLLKELIDTDTGSMLRRDSFNKRKAELGKITNKLDALLLLFGDELVKPQWFKEKEKEFKAYEIKL